MLLASGRVTFALIQKRLLDALRLRLHNGEFTERGLARSVGISQPHIHNVLKGVRILTPEMGDLLMTGLDISLLDLLGPEELGEALLSKQAQRWGSHSVPVLPGRLSPEDPFPGWRTVANWVLGHDAELRALRRPAFVQLGADPAACPAWAGHGFCLLDFDEASRIEPTEPEWYALRWQGAGYLRQVRMHGQELAILGQRTLEGSAGPETISVADGSLLQVVRARLAWVGPDPGSAGSLAQSGRWLSRAARW